MSDVRVVLVDDEPLLRQSLAMIIGAEPGLAVAGEACDGVEAIDVARETAPDVVLMDVRMPRLDGIEATRGICRLPELAHTRVLVLSMFDLDEYIFHALRAGASGFLLKDSRPDELLDAIRRTYAGESLFAPSILARLVERYVGGEPAAEAPRVDRLTAREAEVLTLIGQGLSNDEIAGRLLIAVKTVKSHVSHLLSKLPARDRAQLVIAAYDSGLVKPAPRRG
ncbi:response regulator transcription factor [Actinoplanes sp. NPDC026670]|uniref:response regulator transcription factor n=1 Tax=Actinoplanes sp. NPDC026670 TaxID=3154700 RepID=UPI0033EA60AA